MVGDTKALMETFEPHTSQDAGLSWTSRWKEKEMSLIDRNGTQKIVNVGLHQLYKSVGNINAGTARVKRRMPMTMLTE